MTGASKTQSWNALKPRGPRAAARHAALTASGLLNRLTGRTHAALRRPRVQILILHHVFPEEEAPFRRMLEFLAKYHTFISYSDAVARIESGNIDKPYVTLTFDDGFKNCVRAAEIMNEFGARGCFFICPPIIGESDRNKINVFCRDRLQLPITVDFMDWDDCAALRNAGHDIGGHTMTHANLARISPSEARDEIAQSFDVLQQKLGEVHHFGWTFGGFHDFTPDAAKAVYECGYISCASGMRGAHGPHAQPVARPCLRRDHIVAASPTAHLVHFLIRSSRSLSANTNWPTNWRIDL